MSVNAPFMNFAAGELSSLMRGRFDLPIYQNGSERQENFISMLQGPKRFRSGTRFVGTTRRNAFGIFIPFQFNDSQSYLLVLTEGYMRFFKDEGFITESTKTITGITKANPAVVTSNSHGYSNGDEVYVDGVVGMTEVNGKTFIVAGVTANTFQLTDQDGNNVNSTGYTTYSSGGTAARIVEITTPYLEEDLRALKYGQNADTMYIVHQNYEPRKLTRSSHTAWTLALFSRTADPFTDKKTITGITQASPGVVTSVGHGLVSGDEIIIETVVGMTEINSKVYTVVKINNDTFSLTYEGVAVNTSGYTAYSSAGYASKRNLLPSAFAFYESRAVYGASDSKPETFWLSRAVSSAGVARYDDFTTGTDADHAVIYTLSPSNGKVDKIEWFVGTDRFLAIGTFGGISKVTGSQDDQAISPTSINVRPLDAPGTADLIPAKLGSSFIYLHRNSLVVYSLEFDALADAFVPIDRTLVSDHITKSGIVQVAFSYGKPDLLWAVRTDGLLVALTYKSREDVSGWHRHPIAGTSRKVLSVGVMPIPVAFDQTWLIVERVVDGATRRYVEYFEDDPEIPERDDFFTSATAATTDEATYRRAMAEAQKGYVHLDSCLTYDGSDVGRDAGAVITPAAVTGTGITFTASASVFKSTDVGREIWKKAIDGVGYGRAEITGYTSGTVVTCTVLLDFDATTAIPAGDWYLTTDEISGLEHLEGEVVGVCTDGGEHPQETVADGDISLDYQASVVHVGLPYEGYTKSMDIEAGGVNGPAQGKPRNVNRLSIKFLNTLGAQYGTSLYSMEEVLFRNSDDAMDSPSPLFSGDKVLFYEDVTAPNKYVYIKQTKPMPCIIQNIAVFVETDNF